MAETVYRNESDVKKQVKKLLNKHNFFWWMPAANAYGKAGTSDFLALRAGVFLAIETKFGSNKPTAMQKAFSQSILAEGGFAFVVNEKNVDWLQHWLEAFDRSAMAVSKKEKVSDEDGATMLDAVRAMTALLA